MQCGDQKLTILRNFKTKFRNINVTPPHSLHNFFSKFSKVVGSFVLDHELKLEEIRLTGSGDTGVLM